MEVSEGFQVYCREEQRHWRIQKLIDRREKLKLNGISTGNSRMAKLLPAKLVRDLWKMEFKDMESTLGDMEVTWQWKLCWISERKKISQDRIRWNMKEDRSKSLRD